MYLSVANAALLFFKVLIKKVVYLAPDASSKVVSRVLSVLFATTTHLSAQEIFADNIEQAFKVSRGRIALWIENKVNGKEFGGKRHKTKTELEVCNCVLHGINNPIPTA